MYGGRLTDEKAECPGRWPDLVFPGSVSARRGIVLSPGIVNLGRVVRDYVKEWAFPNVKLPRL